MIGAGVLALLLALQTPISVPLEFDDGRFVLRVVIDGQGPFRFALDTGGVNLVQPELAARLRLATIGHGITHGLGSAGFTTSLVRIPRMQIGDARLFAQQAVVLAVPMRVDGLLGYELFRDFCVTLDNAGGRLILEAAREPQGERIPLSFVGKIPVARGTLNDRPVRLVVDTGNDGALILYHDYWERNRRVFSAMPRAQGEVIGISGVTNALVLEPVELVLGDAALGKFGAVVLPAVRGMPTAGKTDGNLGAQVLRRFVVTFDYAHRILMLRR